MPQITHQVHLKRHFSPYANENLGKSSKIIIMDKDYYPWRLNNAFTLLRDGEQFFSAIFDHIENAKHYVLIEIYLMNSSAVAQQLINALTVARQHGVNVYLLLDDYGSRGLSHTDRALLSQQGVHVSYYNRLRLRAPLRYLPRDHRKIIIIDGIITFIGGLGFSDDFLASSKKDQWRETVVKVEGENCQDWLDAFSTSWQRCSGATLQLSVPSHSTQRAMSQRGHVTLSPVQGQREIRRNIINQLRSAKKRIWISTAYFVPSRKIRRLLRRAARRGVDVRLILPGANTDHPAVRHAGRRFYTRLLHSKVKIYEYQPRFIHQKIVLVDEWVSMGSANMDRWNLRWNLEANQEIDDPHFAKQIEIMLHYDMTECQPLSYTAWCKRTRWGRFLEWFWGQIDQKLAKITDFKNHRSRDK